MQRKNFFLAFFCLSLLLGGCSTNPVTGESELHLVSESQEIAVGEENYRYMVQAEGGPYVTDPGIQKYVEKVGKKLAAVSDRPQLPYEFTVLNNSIPNAWALPGGKIAINRGLLIELHSEAELAAVLAHEIVHSAARHGAKAMERALLMGAGIMGLSQVLQDHKYEDVVVGSAAVGATLVAFKYSRSAELEADRYGIKYMVAAGYDPEAAVQLQETFLKLNEEKNQPWMAGLFATHPPTEERVEANKHTAELYPKGGFVGTRQYEFAMVELFEARPAYEELDRGYKLLARGDPEKALECAKKGINIAPSEAHLYNLKGKALYHLHDYPGALTGFTKAIDLNPDYFDFYLQRGLLEYKMGDTFAAQRDLDKSNELLPSAESYYTLGEIHLGQKNYDLARKNFTIAAQANNTAGLAARRRLSQSSSSGNPAKSVSVAPVCYKGDLSLNITNRGERAIRNLVVEIRFFNKKNELLKKERISIAELIPAGRTVTKRTSVHCPHKTRSTQTLVIRADAS